MVRWGSYSEQLDVWQKKGSVNIHEQGVKDFGYVRKMLLKALTDRERLRIEKENWQKMIDTFGEVTL